VKRIIATIVLYIITLSVYGQNIVSLDEAITNSVLQIQDGLDKGSTIVVYQFQSHNSNLSDYVLKELFDKLVNSRRFIVLDRSDQEVIDAELDFQFNQSAGMISDDSLAGLTRRIGAEAIVTGSLDDAANEYRFRIKVLGTETIAAIVSYAASVDKNDKKISAFTLREPDTTEKLGVGGLNILFGLGSYLEGDKIGGITITSGYVLAVGLFAIESTALDWDSPAVGAAGTVGFVAAGLTMAYGFVRPFLYHRSPTVAALTDIITPNIVLTSDDYHGKANIGFNLSYKYSF
jgi:hypothetical protein